MVFAAALAQCGLLMSHASTTTPTGLEDCSESLLTVGMDNPASPQVT